MTHRAASLLAAVAIAALPAASYGERIEFGFFFSWGSCG
jgi:hypothetical protein